MASDIAKFDSSAPHIPTAKRYDDLIDYNFATFSFDNIAEAETDGVEVYAALTPLDNLRARVGYPYLDNDDDSGGSFAFRRPSHQVDTDLNLAATQDININLYAGFIGEREDVGGTMDSYVLVNLAIHYQVTKNVQLYGRIVNLLDEEYETVAGYNTDDLSAYAGIRLTY